MLLLDTNVVIGVMTGRTPGAVIRLKSELARGTQIALPAPVLFELQYGAAKSAQPSRNQQRIDVFLTAVTGIIAFDREDAVEAGGLRAELEMAGTPIGPYDLMIAAQARRRQVLLVTRNRREFDRVPGLIVADWPD